MRIVCTLAVALSTAAIGYAQAAEPLEIMVGELKRTGLVYAPKTAKTEATPVIFGFHGHGGTAKFVAGRFNYQKHWPEAICVYLQGVPTATKRDPEGAKAGWQNAPGLHDDRDLKFFDAVLEKLKKDYNVDEARIYATGHSNGGGFTYALWAARGDVFAALAPSSAFAGERLAKALKPKPVLHLAGEKDPIVPFDNQKRTMDAVRKINGCDDTAKDWQKTGKLYPSPGGTPFVALIHPGGHEFPADAPAKIAAFFKEHKK